MEIHKGALQSGQMHMQDDSLAKGSGGLLDTFLGPFPARFLHLDWQLGQIVTNGSKTCFLGVQVSWTNWLSFSRNLTYKPSL
ncbi:Grip1-Associated Protein 1 [Manis pentadactyla]|nr:Grip1-Associated Protein 1 [Manis pentadactyla]